MDAFESLLSGPRAHAVFALRAEFDPPWALRVEDEAPLTIVLMVRGEAWARYGTEEPVYLAAGDVGLLRGPTHYTMSDAPGTKPQMTIGPGQQASGVGGKQATAFNRGVRTWGNADCGETSMVVGTYNFEAEVSQRLLDALPPMTVVRHDVMQSPYLELLANEIIVERPGQAPIIDRLIDIALLDAARCWLVQPENQAPGWFAASSHPAIAEAVDLMHRNPAHPWTVAELARTVGMSRAGFARRFTDIVGEPPFSYLTTWRITLAADLLREPGATVTSVASQVGYGSPFALSEAFQRERGIRPTEHQRRP